MTLRRHKTVIKMASCPVACRERYWARLSAAAALDAMTLPTLSLLETRILGVLVEKQHTVPDSYPLSLNALTLGCNQKTARDPVVNASDGNRSEERRVGKECRSR